MDLTNPTNMPDPSTIELMEEPVVSAEIMVTTEFVGAIMKLCQERRGTYLGMEYMEATRALLKYELPLNEIIYDFFDALKSRSRGYASFDYELKGYAPSNLVKLDILINKEEVEFYAFPTSVDQRFCYYYHRHCDFHPGKRHCRFCHQSAGAGSYWLHIAVCAVYGMLLSAKGGHPLGSGALSGPDEPKKSDLPAGLSLIFSVSAGVPADRQRIF